MDGSQLLRDTTFVNESLNFNNASASEGMLLHDDNIETNTTTTVPNHNLSTLILDAAGARTIQAERAPISSN